MMSYVMQNVEVDGSGEFVHVACTPDGKYIGPESFAKKLTEEMGIVPELIPGHRVCSIGFCEREQKWYGWSHRAIYGFGIGSSVKKGDCAYSPTDFDDFVEAVVRFWADDCCSVTSCDGVVHVDEDGVRYVVIEWVYNDQCPNEALHGTKGQASARIPDEWGHGEWTAQSLDDAKRMAIDFANGVD